MVVRYGRACEEGFLPVFSVGSEDEAQKLLTLTCPKSIKGEFLARELAVEQSLDNLQAFSDRLSQGHDILVKNGSCDCKEDKSVEKCYHCEKEVGKEFYCYGCKQHVCDDCEDLDSVHSNSMGPHDPMDHVTPFEEGSL